MAVSPPSKRARDAKWRRENPKQNAANTRRWRAEHPEAAADHQALQRKVDSGSAAKPTKCQKCGRTARLHAAHAPGSYGKPKVAWLCPACHKRQEWA